MKVPPIRYVHTDEDALLAYTVFGDGPPLLYSFAVRHFRTSNTCGITRA